VGDQRQSGGNRKHQIGQKCHWVDSTEVSENADAKSFIETLSGVDHIECQGKACAPYTCIRTHRLG